MVLEDLNYEGLLYIVQNMRAKDREEVFATGYRFDADSGMTEDEFMARMSYDAGTKRGIAFLAYRDGEPIAVIGMSMMWPGVASVWMYSTDSWPLVALPLTRWAKKNMISLMESAAIHRAQCWSLSGHDVAHRWLKMLGASEECVVPGYGRDGETFHLFGWSKGRNF